MSIQKTDFREHPMGFRIYVAYSRGFLKSYNDTHVATLGFDLNQGVKVAILICDPKSWCNGSIYRSQPGEGQLGLPSRGALGGIAHCLLGAQGR